MYYDIIAIGGAMRDIIFYTREGLVLDNSDNPVCERLIAFELGAKVHIKEVYFGTGGGAINSAVGFSRLGIKTAVLARVGDDREGDSLIKEMRKQKIDTRFIQKDKRISTGFSFILSLFKKRAHAIFAYHGATDFLQLPNKESNSFTAKWLYVSSLGLNWSDVLDKIFRFKMKNKALIAWNPSNTNLQAGYQGLAKYLKSTDLFILNKDEARELVLSKYRKTNNLEVRRLLKEIYQMGAKIVAITVGPEGAYAYDGQKVYYQREMPAKVVNSTGAGDAFSSGFIASLIYKPNDIKRALYWGVANSTSVIKKIGAQKGLLTKKQMLSK